MNRELTKIFLIGFLILLVKSNFYSQLTVTSATGCPNQAVTLNASWPNVGSITYTISRASGSPTFQTSSTFTVSDSGPTSVVFTITANGTALSGPVTGTTTATLTIVPPAPMTITNTTNYCYNSTATLVAPVGSAYNYTVTGPTGAPAFPTFNSNVIHIPNLISPNYNGQYTVTANFNGCTTTGTTQINVAPNSLITINPPVGVCQGAAFVSFNASLASGIPNTFMWAGQNFTMSGTAPSHLSPQPTDSGPVTLTASFSFNTITCPAPVATTTLNVVATSTIAISASPSKTVCQSSTLTIAPSTTATASGWSWTGPQYSSSLQNANLSNVTSADAGIYSVTAIFFSNAQTCSTTNTIAISVIPTAIPNVVSPTNICQNDTAYLSATANGASGFSWTGPNNFTSSVATPSIAGILPAASGIYYITAKFGSIPCTTTKSVVINVVPINSITVIPPTPVCQPDDGYLQANSIGAISATWVGPNGNVGNTANTTLYHPNLNANGIYTITMGFGGSGLTCYNTNTAQLIVKPLLNFSITAPGLVCYNDNVHIDGPAGATSYSWTSTASFSASTQSIDLLSMQPSDAGTYFLTVSLNGCTTTANTTIDVLPQIQFAQPFFDRNICKGDTIFLDAPINGGSGNIAYVWDPSIYLSSGTGSSVVGVPLGTTVYNISAHDIACPHYTLSASVNVNVKQPPTLNLHLDRIEGCAPLSQLYNSESGKAAAWVTYDFGGNLKYQQDSTIISLNNPGTYTLNVTLTGTNGCSGTVTYPQTIFVYPTPVVNITTDPEIPTITDDITFGASSNTNLSSYTWIFDTGAQDADTMLTANPVKSFVNSGTYPILLIATTDMGCADTIVRFLEIRENFNVFIPNSFTPNGDNINDVFQMKGSGLSADNFSMELFNRKGQVLFSTRDINSGWDGVTNGSKVQQDVYVYKITVVGAHNEGRKQYIGNFSLLR